MTTWGWGGGDVNGEPCRGGWTSTCMAGHVRVGTCAVRVLEADL